MSSTVFWTYTLSHTSVLLWSYNFVNLGSDLRNFNLCFKVLLIFIVQNIHLSSISMCYLWCYVFSVNMALILEINCSKRRVLYTCIIIGLAVSVGWIHTATSSASDHRCSGNVGRTVSTSPAWDIRTETAWHCGGGWNMGKKLVPGIETMRMCVINYYI